MKSLAIVFVAGWISVGTWGTPTTSADSKLADTDSYSQEAQNSFPDDSAKQGAAPQAPASDSTAKESGGISGVFGKWFRTGERIEAGEPNWLSPLATTSGRLKQEFRYDVLRQPGTASDTDYNFGAGKGLEFIVAPRIQLMVGPPPYIAHEGGKAPDGYADIPVMLKLGMAAAGPGEGDYLITLLLSATVPGGSNSMRDAVISPGIALGKGWRKLDLQTTFGGNLPTGDTAVLGRQLLSNTALQYRAPWNLWPEVEINSTFFLAGKNTGQTQVFLTPGLGFGRIRLWRALKFSSAAGMQIANTRFHTYNHRAVFSIRYSF